MTIDVLKDENELVRVSELWLELIREFCPKYAPNVEWWLLECNVLFKMENFKVFVVRDDDERIVGFCTVLVYNDPATGERIGAGREFYVMPEYRKTRMAYRLMKDSEGYARKMGATLFEMYVVSDRMKFWFKRGYVPMRAIMLKEA